MIPISVVHIKSVYAGLVSLILPCWPFLPLISTIFVLIIAITIFDIELLRKDSDFFVEMLARTTINFTFLLLLYY